MHVPVALEWSKRSQVQATGSKTMETGGWGRQGAHRSGGKASEQRPLQPLVTHVLWGHPVRDPGLIAFYKVCPFVNQFHEFSL